MGDKPDVWFYNRTKKTKNSLRNGSKATKKIKSQYQNV